MIENNKDYIKMIHGDLYDSSNKELGESALERRVLVEQYNATSIKDTSLRDDLLANIVGKKGEHVTIWAPMYVDHGRNISIGDNFFANYDCIFLDAGPISIGDNVMVGPRVSFLTATHPTDSLVRNRGLEYAKAIRIGHGVWIGGGASILPGITVADNAIIAAGSVVTKDVPENTIVAGNPARVIRQIEENESKYWESKEAEYYDAT